MQDQDGHQPSFVTNRVPWSAPRKILFTIALLLLYNFPVCCRGEDSDVNNYDTDNVQEDVFDDDISPAYKNEEEEWYMVLIFSLGFGFVITLFGAFVGYFSILEDNLMRKYRREGILIYADVVSSEFARGGGQVAIFTKQRDNPEYIAFVEYNQQICANYTVRVRKQVKAKASDFRSSPQPGTTGMLLSIKLQDGNPSPQAGLAELTQDPCGDDWDGCSISAVDVPRKFLEILVLPQYERSGYPLQQVERACSIRYRLSTIGLIAFIVVLAAYCTCSAANDVSDQEQNGNRVIGLYSIAAFVILISLQVPIIHCYCHSIFLDALKEEYLESGEFVPLPCDESSLSSGSDIFLSLPSSRQYSKKESSLSLTR
jgi:hypothetical protein